MLSKLTINNFILIDNVNIDFSHSLNIIIGETGSGKSIIIEALMLLFGEKSSTDFVRLGANKAVIEASFFFSNDSNLFGTLAEMGIECESNEVIIRREIALKGNSRCFINDSPVTVSLLKLFARSVVDFHGQNEQQKILEKDEQLNIIDKLIDDKSILTNYRNAYREFAKLINEYNVLINKKDTSEERNVLITKELKDIDDIDPKPNEDNKINNELKLLENAEYLVDTADKFISLIDSKDSATDRVITNLSEANHVLNDLLSIDKDFVQYKKEFEAATISIRETLNHIISYKNTIEYNPERIEKLRNRYTSIRKIIKKYGSIEDTLNIKTEYENELKLIDNYDETIIELKNNIEIKRAVLSQLAMVLRDKRKIISKSFEAQIEKSLANMGIENAVFNVHFSVNSIKTYFKQDILPENNDELIVEPDIPYIICDSNDGNKQKIRVNETGADVVEFFISANKGEPLASIAMAASGGEISRIMLAIKTIMAASDDTPLLIFDEIDTGISGRIAQKVGKSMKNLSLYHQVIAITHLPQIAALGEKIILIEKNESNDRVSTTARHLSETEKTTEIAKMLSGEKITDATLKSAKELMK